MANRPARPGRAWEWNANRKKWVKPDRPTSGEWRWDDDRGWVSQRGGNQGAQTTGSPGANDVTGPNQTVTPPPETTSTSAAAPTVVRTEEVQEGTAATGFYSVTYTYYSDGSKVETNRVANAGRRNVYDNINLTLQQASWGVDLTVLMPVIDQWLQDGYADASNGESIILNMLQSSNVTLPNSSKTVAQLFAERFPGFAAANSNGRNMTLAEYRTMESDYINTMQRYNLPTEMYDNPTDFGKLIAGDVSVAEVDSRIQTAQTMLASTDPSVVDAFQRYYGVARGDLLAYMLDGEKGQGIIEQRTRTAEVGGTAARYGFDLSADQATGYSNQGLLSGYRAVTPNSSLTGQTERIFSDAADLRMQDTRLSGIDQEQYSANDALDVAFGDKQKELASKKRAEREAARFGGNSGVTTQSVSRRRSV